MQPFFLRKIFSFLLVFCLINGVNAQMRQIHVEPTATSSSIYDFSFYSPSHGYIASDDNGSPWVGFTSDSGRTITKRHITFSNVNTGAYSVSLPFMIKGVKAFSQDTIVVYGGFNITPAILYSTDGGLTYLLTYHFQGPNQAGFIYDMIFPQNNGTGYAVDGYRILKTTSKGQSWTTSFTDNAGFFSALDATDNNNVFAFPDVLNGTSNKFYKTSTAGGSWQQVTVPGSEIYTADFITPSKGWINVRLNDSLLLYYTSTAGASWIRKNDGYASSVGFYKMRFVNDSTGYGLGMTGAYDTYKTTDTARVWEPLPRDNSYNYFSYGHFEMQEWNENQIWCGGENDFIEITTNGGGNPLPKAYFTIDTIGVKATGIVKLLNYSKRNYAYKWFVNNVQVSTNYNTTFNHITSNISDSIKLIVTNGTISDTTLHVQYYSSLVNITSVNPLNAITGTIVTITGTGFTGATSVTFGGTPAASFTVNSNTSITATVGSGSSGLVRVISPLGQGIYVGFSYTPPPVITSFSPTSAATGATIIISGLNFTGTTAVNFGIFFAASFTVLSPTTIQAVVPNSTGPTISVTTPGGVGTLGGFTFIPFPRPFSVTPNVGGTGTVVEITGINFSGATNVKFGGVSAASFTLNSPTSITATVGAGASGAVTVTTPGGTDGGPTFTYTTLPIIHNTSPLNGPVGTTVTITGANFSPNVLNNVIYFGPVKATVTSATANTLTIVVPVAAASGFITVLTDSFVAVSPREFEVTFPGDLVFTANSFAGRIDFASGNYTNDVAVADFDGDGKPDMVSVNTFEKTISLFRNTSTPGNLSFAPRIDSSAGTFWPVKISIGDIDGDGKLDIAVVGRDPSGVSNAFGRLIIYRNTSVPGSVSFGPRIEIGCGSSPSDILIANFNKDGKQDVLVLNGGDESITLFRNTSSGSSISFIIQNTVSLLNGSNFHLPSTMAAADFDADGNLDIVIGKQNSTYLTFILNTSSGFNPAAVVFFGSLIGSGSFSDVAISDLDGDGKIDIVTNNYVFRNTTTLPFNLNFSPQQGIGSGNSGCVSGLNGDTKPDFVRNNFSTSTVSAIRNTSSTGSISLVIDANYATDQSPVAVATADFDLDHRPDILVANRASNNVSILKSQVQYTGPVIYSFTPTTGLSGTLVTINGVKFTGATAVSFGGTMASSFNVVNDNTITATVGNGATGIVSILTPAGIASLPQFNFIGNPTISSFTPNSGTTGTTVTITGTNLTGATAVNFGSIAASSFTVVNSTTITAVVGNGASGNVSVTTPGGTATRAGFTYIPAPTITSFTPVSGATGTTVTITGTNFTGASSVSFGSVAASSFTVVNSTTITAVVGDGASGNVSVTTPGGTATSAGFTYIPAPTIILFTPVSGPTGTTVTITGTNFTGASSVGFGSVAASSFTVVNSTTITAMVGNGASGNISVTTPGGTVTKTGFTFIPPPVITSFTPINGASGTTITIIGSNFTGASGVSFGGVIASSFIVVNPNTISAIVSSGATGNISVTTPGGTATSLATFTYDVLREGIIIKPNPANDIVTVTHPVSIRQSFLKLIDLNGRTVKLRMVSQNSGSTFMSVKGIPTGLYKLIWTDEETIFERTLMITH